ncbi:MAG TPA: Asp-tRNA(Asn)/Glu-tRNA(Gln) amidotransferase subunit GatC [Bacillota bacterium]
MSLSQSEVEHVARLACLELSETEKQEFTGQLNQILHFFAKLDRIDTAGVAVTVPATKSVKAFRPDQVETSLEPELALANAPERLGNFFKVPKVLEETEKSR